MTLAHDHFKACTSVSNHVERSGSVPQGQITYANWPTPHTCKDPWQPRCSAAAVQIGHGEGTVRAVQGDGIKNLT